MLAEGSRKLIASDAAFATSLLARPIDSRSQALNALYFTAHMRMIVFEGARHLEESGFVVSPELRARISSSRNSLKLLDNRPKVVRTALATLSDLVELDQQHFAQNNAIPGLIARFDWLRRLLITDTTVHLSGQSIIATSQSLRFHLDLRDAGIPPEAIVAESARVGEALRMIAMAVGVDNLMEASSASVDPRPMVDHVQEKDVLAEVLYANWFPGVPLRDGAALGLLAAEAASHRRLLETWVERDGDPSAVKFGFVAAHHLYRSISGLIAMDLGVRMTPDLRAALVSVADDESHRWLKLNEARVLRNSLVHYGLIEGFQPDMSAPLLGLADYYLDWDVTQVAVRSMALLEAVEAALWCTAADVFSRLQEPAGG